MGRNQLLLSVCPSHPEARVRSSSGGLPWPTQAHLLSRFLSLPYPLRSEPRLSRVAAHLFLRDGAEHSSAGKKCSLRSVELLKCYLHPGGSCWGGMGGGNHAFCISASGPSTHSLPEHLAKMSEPWALLSAQESLTRHFVSISRKGN